MSDKVSQEISGAVSPERWLIRKWERNLECMEGHDCVDGDKGLTTSEKSDSGYNHSKRRTYTLFVWPDGMVIDRGQRTETAIWDWGKKPTNKSRKLIQRFCKHRYIISRIEQDRVNLSALTFANNT